MMWPTQRFGDLYSIPSRNGMSRPSRVRGEGYKMVNMGELFANDRIGDIPMELVPMNQKELEQSSLCAGDLLFARQSLVLEGAGKCSIVTEVPEITTFESHLIRVRLSKEKSDPRFYYYLFSSPYSGMSTIVQQCAQAGIRASSLAELKVLAPPLEAQERIADTLTAYDDLMENNRRRMALLEESVRLLYREWFVHLRFPGHEHTRLTNGLPKGWAVKPLEDVAEFRLGKMLDQKKNRGEPLPYLANVNVRWGEFDLTNLREMRFEERELETFGLKFGDIVMCEGGEPGRCAIWKDQMPGMMFQKAIHRIRCRENMDHEYLYQNLRHQAASGHFATLFTGATIKHFPREKLAKVTVVVPPKRLLDLFLDHARPIETQLGLLEAANKRAKEARDLLLPRLMAGQIEI